MDAERTGARIGDRTHGGLADADEDALDDLMRDKESGSQIPLDSVAMQVIHHAVGGDRENGHAAFDALNFHGTETGVLANLKAWRLQTQRAGEFAGQKHINPEMFPVSSTRYACRFYGTFAA